MRIRTGFILAATVATYAVAAHSTWVSRVGPTSPSADTNAAAPVRASTSPRTPMAISQPESYMHKSGTAVAGDPYATVTTEPPVPAPSMLCGTSHLDNLLLDESTQYQANFVATEPPGCAAGWAKVILEIDYRYDENTAYPAPAGIALWLGGANLFFGGAPSVLDPPGGWHVERDVTDYATLIRRGPNSGRVAIDDAFVEANPDLAMRVSFRFKFFAPTTTERTPRKADVVYPLSTYQGAMTPMHTGEHHPSIPPSSVAAVVTLPRNVEHAYLDVLALGVRNDWVWWSCVPSHFYEDMPDLVRGSPFLYTSSVGSCLRGAFREAEVRIDGVPAGVAPVFPWIPPAALTDSSSARYALFRPTPPPRALNVMPYRVDLSPFAGVLSDGTPHRIAVTIASSDPSIDVEATAALLVYRDNRTRAIAGAVTRNTLAGVSSIPTITESLSETAGHVTGNLHTTQNRHFVIEGYIDTARGRIRNRVEQTSYFDNTQTFDVLSTSAQYRYWQNVRLISRTYRASTKLLGSTQLRYDRDYQSFPLIVSDETAWPRSAPGDGTDRLAVSQGVHQTSVHQRPDVARYTTGLHETYDALVHTHTTNSSFDLFQVMSTQAFDFTDARGSCFSAALATRDSALSDFLAGGHCPNGLNYVRWFARPDGSPDSLAWAGYN